VVVQNPLYKVAGDCPGIAARWSRVASAAWGGADNCWRRGRATSDEVQCRKSRYLETTIGRRIGRSVQARDDRTDHYPPRRRRQHRVTDYWRRAWAARCSEPIKEPAGILAVPPADRGVAWRGVVRRTRPDRKASAARPRQEHTSPPRPAVGSVWRYAVVTR